MLRRIILCLGTFALAVGAFAGTAAAQDDEFECRYNDVVIACASPTPSSGLAESFADQGGPTADTVPTPAPTPEATDDSAAPDLAFTGSESEVLAYVGSGLIAAGAGVLVLRRRLSQD